MKRQTDRFRKDNFMQKLLESEKHICFGFKYDLCNGQTTRATNRKNYDCLSTFGISFSQVLLSFYKIKKIILLFLRFEYLRGYEKPFETS